MSLAENRFFGLESSAALLVAGNLSAIALAIAFDWGVLTIMWGYWLQSAVIGLFTVPKILLSPSINPVLEKIIGEWATGAAQIIGKIFLAGFFALHYGGFHFGYLVFLIAFSFQGGLFNTPFKPVDYAGIAFFGVVFFFTHMYSFYLNYFVKRERVTAQTAFSEPYRRIMPMHLTIILGMFLLGVFPQIGEKLVLTLFMLLKTFVDYSSHKSQHRES
ncbi:MAG TPA: DUF6498-containing protein [archaeon]|nr:DUF6498-containing protein [archaeon]